MTTTGAERVAGTPHRFDSEGAREAARVSVRRRRRRLALEDVEAAFGPLETLEAAMYRLDRLGVWITAGLLAGSAGTAAVRSVEVWVRAHESKLTQEVVEQLRGRLEHLETQTARARAGRP